MWGPRAIFMVIFLQCLEPASAINGTALVNAAQEAVSKTGNLRALLAKIKVTDEYEAKKTCWVSRHALWDCGLECYATSSHEWRPCASKCAQFHGEGASCNYCLSDLVHCVLLQCVSPCAASTHAPSCETCILAGCNDKCWNP
ncbi:unnamed protein product [Symbiodinium natans]|uniref:Uncharacterized protein n=1 Tax=Symbiodinium natans TaxID=878477 RepID=A0A812K773_9DINO|nr:unnamed protein product [Symbiodinium natans]